MRIGKFSFKRTDDQKLLNTPELVTVGGCDNAESVKDVYIREPSLRATGELIMRVVKTLETLAEEEKTWVDRVLKNPSLIKSSDFGTFKPLVDIVEDELARIVGEDTDYVNDAMSPRQATEVGATWLKVVGFERIRDLFFQIRGEFEAVMPSKPKSEASERGPNIIPSYAAPSADEALSSKQ